MKHLVLVIGVPSCSFIFPSCQRLDARISMQFPMSLNSRERICLFRKDRHAEPLMPSFCLFIIRAYRLVFTPLKMMLGLQGCCRFSPSCSHYVEEAICTHGVCRGVGLGTRRILRCHPWGGHGYDPVPPGGQQRASGLCLK